MRDLRRSTTYNSPYNNLPRTSHAPLRASRKTSSEQDDHYDEQTPKPRSSTDPSTMNSTPSSEPIDNNLASDLHRLETDMFMPKNQQPCEDSHPQQLSNAFKPGATRSGSFTFPPDPRNDSHDYYPDSRLED
ncbi:hypothetical protein EDB84DRAFT_1572674 [Lactarius hengduanensis]|nr:hypothetical protein EDB84DRAFT_1572674 [Lactarius hengduanensis]